ncbi:MAG TPA: hypothetical protein PLF50_00075 [Candidatus Cloacimonadota bacterium]|nr:hypothetical protein [Candidatus Cloacimonadota bacterium]
MPKRFFLIITFAIIICGIYSAQLPSKYYLPNYYPFIYNQVDIYKINKGISLYKQNPYLVRVLGPATQKIFDLDSMRVIISTKVGDESLYPDVYVPLEKYFANLEYQIYHRSLTTQILTAKENAATQTGGLIRELTLDIPSIAMPKTMKKILGNKPGRLNLDGTQRITMTGTSTKRKIIPIYETDHGSRFDFKMKQDTNINLSGTIGEKINVLLKYNSNQDETLFDPNNINIKYTGDEDEVVQKLEAGDIALSLSGSRYISYSTSSQGLFGITSKFKFGALDLTAIASKEEGQKNTKTYIGQSQADSTIIYSKNFAYRTFYYLEKPQDIYNLYTSADPNIPNGWIGNAIKTTAGKWQVLYPALLPKNGTVKVYLDDGDATNNVASIQGETIHLSSTEEYTPYYDELIEGTDFITDYMAGTIEILKLVDRRYTIAVQYTRRDETLVPENSNVQDGVLHAKVIRTRNQEYDPNPNLNYAYTWDYQMRNIYSMGLTNIKKDDFKLEVYTENTDRTRNYNVPDSLTTSGITTYNEYLNLDSSGDGRVNGDDATVNLTTGYIIIPFIKPFYALGDTLIYQDENENITYDEFKHYISVYGKIGRDIISLGQTGVLKGSVKVKVNGVTQKENIDYIVDYDMGQITFLSAAGKDPNAKIEIDYEYRSGFAVASKSLVGVRADYNISDNSKFGGTIIYRSETVSDKRPKIGNENIKLFMADIDGSTSLKTPFITRWIDALPLIKTNAESKISLSGEAALTMPNISGDDQHPNEAFIDDMEGILDSYPLGLSYSTWVLASHPYQTSLPRCRVNWYNPLNVKMQQVYDPATLTNDEKDDNITVLAMKLFPNTIQQEGQTNWCQGGIMKYVGNQLDFSNKKYIELLVKVDKYGETQPNVTLHVDLGDINEDFYTDYGGLNVLNNEDSNHDGDFTTAEDTGLDGIPDGQPGDDPNDNAEVENADSNGDYPHKNGTEHNNLLDTEDLDNDGVLDQLDRYITYTASITNINPTQNPYLVSYIPSTKYLLIRIPLNEITEANIINSSTSNVQPTLKKISYARIWAETNIPARVLIASAQIVGNKWEDFFVRYYNNTIVPPTVLETYGESFLSGIVDNQKSNHYTSPKNTFYTESNKPTLEQSLTLEVNNIQPGYISAAGDTIQGHKVLLRQKLIEYYNLLSYRKIVLWAYPENAANLPFTAGKTVDIIFRMGADSLNYYQARIPLPVLDYNTPNGKMQRNWWKSIEFDLQDFSSIKDVLQQEKEYYNNGKYFSYKGTPTLTNIREFILGVQNNRTDGTPYSGIVYLDDIRVADPFEDAGVAGRLTLNSIFADFATLDVDYEQKSENFNSNIQRGTTLASGFTSSNSLNISNKFFLDKFFPNTWGMRLPLNLERNYSLFLPRYRANSDILRSSIMNPEDKDREKTENLYYAATLGISQTTPPRSPVLAYTINKMNFSGKVSNTINKTATSVDTTFAWQGTFNYNLNLPENTLSLPIYKSYKIKFIPNSFTNNFNITSSDPKSYNWEKRDTLSGWFTRPQTLPTKYINTDNGFTWPLTSDFNTTFRLITKRDLVQKNYWKGVNVGKESEFDQNIGCNYNPNFIPQILTLSNSLDTRYTENQRKYLETVSGEQVNVYYKDGNSTRTIRVNLTLQNSDLLNNLLTKVSDNDKIKSESKEIKYEEQKKEEDKLYNKDNEQPKEPEFSEDEKKKAEIMIEEQKKMEEKKRLEQEQQEQNEKDIQKTQEFEKGISAPSDILNKVNEKEEKKKEQVSEKSNFNLTATMVGVVSRIKNISGTYQNGYTQIFTSKHSRPNYAFLLGLPHQVPLSFLDSRENNNTYTISSGYIFSRKIDSTLNYSYSINQRYANASNQTVAVTFPDISLTVSDLDDLIGIKKYFDNTRLNSSFQYTLRQTGDLNWVKPKQETKTWSYNPLASITTNITKDLQATIAGTITKSDNITDMVSYDIIRASNAQGINGNFTYSFRSSTGMRLPFSNKKINLRNELTSALNIAYTKNYDTTKGSGDTQIDTHTTKITISPSAGYQFDQNIRGGLNGNYEITRDKKRDDRIRIFSLSIWVEITL